MKNKPFPPGTLALFHLYQRPHQLQFQWATMHTHGYAQHAVLPTDKAIPCIILKHLGYQPISATDVASGYADYYTVFMCGVVFTVSEFDIIPV